MIAKIKQLFTSNPNLSKTLLLIFGIFAIALVVHISEYAYSSFDINEIPYNLYLSSDSESSLIFAGDSNLNYMYKSKSFFLSYTIKDGHINAIVNEEESIDFYIVKDCIYDKTNNLMLFPAIIE